MTETPAEPGPRPAASDAAVREEVIASTAQTMLVEAAAGTGKTTLLVHRMLRAVLDGRIRLARTVAITFTEKAAAELASRIRAGLLEALHGEGLSPEERRRLRTAIGELDRASISTIHAFCAQTLREKSAEGGVDPEFGVLDETQRQVLIERAWQEWMGREVTEAPETLVEALRAGVGAEGLKAAAFKLAERPELLEAGLFEVPRPAQTVEAALAEARRTATEATRVFAEQMKGKGNKDSRRLRRLAGELAGVEDDAAARRLCYAVAAIPVAAALTSFPKGQRDEPEAVLTALNAATADVGAHLAADALGWLARFVEHFGEAKRERSVLDFQDLLLLAARLLRDDAAVRRYFQRRFDALFVDEFQDTDPLQAELVAYLCEEKGGRPARRMDDVQLADGRLFVVGDPKQSIYRFRRADVQVYDGFKGLFGEERTRQVYCNFRSTPALLDWFNRLFEPVFAEPQPEGVYQAPHVALAAPESSDTAADTAVLALCAPPDLPTDEWNAPEARRHEARLIARALGELTRGTLPGPERKFRWGDFALLFRSLNDVGFYEDAFDAEAIPYRVVGGKHFYQREQVVETLALLQAVDDPLNEPAVVGALRSSFFGLSDEDLLRYREGGGRWNYLLTDVRSGPVGEAMGMLRRWHGRRNRVEPHVLLREVFDATRAPQAFLLKPAGEQRVANLRKLANQLDQLGRATGNFSAAVRHLSLVHEAELPEEESSVVEPGDDFVLLLTMHKAKGLQFNAVLLPDLARNFARAGKADSLVVDRERRRVGLELDAGLRTEGYGELAEREVGNQLAELRRLLYVACTRARELLILPLYWRLRGAKQSFQALLAKHGGLAKPGEVPFGEERGGVLYVDTRGRLAGMDLAPPPYAARPPEAEEAERLLAERERWRQAHAALGSRASAGPAFVLPSASAGPLEPPPPGEDAARGTAGRMFGTLFHNLMAALPLASPADEETRRLARAMAAVEADALGMDGAAAAAAADLAIGALGHEEFARMVRNADALAAEAAFCVALDRLPGVTEETDGFLEGSIDLLLELPERTVVLDYKTDALGPERLDEAADRYGPQLALYALAAEACGRARGEVELALFFVRRGVIIRRPMDAAARQAAARHIRRVLDERRSSG
jgi:ATP-dependent helicase/nuclease subunit A